MLSSAVFTYSLSFITIILGIVAIAALPWSTKDLEATDRGLRYLATALTARVRGWWG